MPSINQQDQEKNYWECQESSLGLLGSKRECNPLRYVPPPPSFSKFYAEATVSSCPFCRKFAVKYDVLRLFDVTGRERRRCLRLDREAHILIALKKKMVRHRDFDLINSERSQAENFRTLVVCFVKAVPIFIKPVTGVRRLDRKSKIETFRSISQFLDFVLN